MWQDRTYGYNIASFLHPGKVDSNVPVMQPSGTTRVDITMYDPVTVPGKHRTLTYGTDEFGEFGSVFNPDTEFEIPTPQNSIPVPELEEIAAAGPSSTGPSPS